MLSASLFLAFAIPNDHMFAPFPCLVLSKIFRDLSLYGFHADGGGGGVGNIGGIAEKMVFLSMPNRPVLISDIEISAATKPAFAARVGSV